MKQEVTWIESLRFSFYFTNLWSYDELLHGSVFYFVLWQWQRFRIWSRICQSHVELILMTPALCMSSLYLFHQMKDFGPEDGFSLELMSQKSTTLWFVFCFLKGFTFTIFLNFWIFFTFNFFIIYLDGLLLGQFESDAFKRLL